MATIAMVDFDFDDCDFERAMVEAAGIEFTSFSHGRHCTADEIIAHAAGADGIITSYGRFTAEVIAALPAARVISKTGTGVDNLDVAAATAGGIAVCNVPAYGTEVVSDHAIALALACLRRINEIDADMRAGVWNFRWRRPLGQVTGRTFAVVGYGNIGRATAALGFSVVVWDRHGQPGTLTAEGFPYLAFDEALRAADVVSFHTALTPETRYLLNADNIALLGPGAIVVNTSRGAVIDTDAVAAALILEGKIPWAIAADLRRGPLDRARATVQEYGLTGKVAFRLCNGLTGIQPDEVDAVAIAGMGGETIAAVLSAAPWVRGRNLPLVLQPMSSFPDLRGWLQGNGFAIQEERLAREGEMLYTALLVRAGEMEPLSLEELWAGKNVNTPLRGAWLDRWLARTRRALEGMAQGQNVSRRRQELEEVCQGLAEMKKEWEQWQQ